MQLGLKSTSMALSEENVEQSKDAKVHVFTRTVQLLLLRARRSAPLFCCLRLP